MTKYKSDSEGNVPERKKKRRGHGEGTIYQRESDGRWVAELTLEDGSRKYFYAKKQEDVIKKLQYAQYELKQGTLATGPRQKFGVYLDQWFEDIRKMKLRPASYRKYRGLLDKHILPALGQVQMQKLTAQMIQAFYNKKLKEGLSPSSIQSIHNILHPAFENAIKWRLIAHNPSQGITLPPLTKLKVQSLTVEQAQHLLAVAHGDNLEAFVALALATGMRHGEMTALRWDDINFEEGSIYIHRTASHQARFKVVEGEPKTKSSQRLVLIPTEVCDVLKSHRIKQKELRLQAGSAWQERNLVFCNKIGGFLKDQTIMRQFHKLLAKAGLPPMRIHDLRHSAASILLAIGVNPKVVQEMLGHSNMSMTMNTYAHVLPSLQKEATEKIKRLFL